MKVNAAFSGFSVDDQAKAKDFYTNVLGFALDNEEMGLNLRLPHGGTLFIYEKPGHQPATYTALNLIVDSIDEAVDELTEKGVSFEHYDNIPGEQDEKGIMRSPDPEKYGPSIAWFKDPAGNILAVLQDDNK